MGNRKALHEIWSDANNFDLNRFELSVITNTMFLKLIARTTLVHERPISTI